MDFTFQPVSCQRGRKWRGNLAYYLGQQKSNSFGDFIATLYDPATNKYVYANLNFLTNLTSTDNLETHRQAYLDFIYTSNFQYCQSCKPAASSLELKAYLRNLLLKYHPELQEWINIMLPDQRDPAQEVEKTIKWAQSLRTREMYLYGKHCPGGKPYSEQKVANIAYAALKKRGITKLQGFELAWQFFADLYSLPKPSST